MENLRVYWLDVINEKYDYNVFNNDDMFITEAYYDESSVAFSMPSGDEKESSHVYGKHGRI